ncbi:MAG TPA: Xaa-Pro peptidase family protein [Actinomycetota bacterium]|nr:Xaa-Pro peptidase family protein [Actinomycetota bacterium]
MSVRAEVLRREVEAMKATGLDALVATSPENFAYLAGFVVPSQPILRWRHAATVVTADGELSVLSVDMEATTVRDRLPDADVRVWREFADEAMDVLADALRDRGLERARVGVETDHLPARDLARLRELLPHVRFEPAQGIFNRLRMVKTAEELELLRRLSRITDQAIARALESVRAGDTERDLAAAVTGELYRLGAEHHKFLIVATGERSRFPNVGPTERALRPGDVIRLEIFGVLNGYHAGVCRTAVVQQAPAEVQRVADNLAACRSLVLEAMRPGVPARSVYRAFIEKFAELGYRAIDFVGHGIGLHVHEEPYLSDFDETVLEQGMVFGVEPLLYGPEFGVQFKDVVAVGNDGAEVLSDVVDGQKLMVVP